LTKALSLADHALAQYLLGSVHPHHRAAEGIVKCEHALGLDRNLADAHVKIGVAKTFTGRAEEGCRVLEAPRPPARYGSSVGLSARVVRSFISAAPRRLLLGCAGPLKLTQIILWRTSFSLPRAQISAR
jgi:hypothetical protein